MREISMHIMDIVQNSISANADVIEININEDFELDLLQISIIDNGRGMAPELLKTVSDPFSTTRTTRKVGLGISLFKAAAERCDGELKISSTLGKGTVVDVRFVHSHIDRAPLGNMSETILSLVVCNPSIDFIYRHTVNNNDFEFDTRKIKQIIGHVDINNIEVVSWMREYLNEGITNLYGGAN
ncbi:MAG: hypothetical protein PWP27_1896 [Clostridiales bacterium]|jgi:hypothetical protein|nr:hypothetical protein [Clostridiales bacterium]MDK2934086.1 hypothetical protein [Clostridiales bacterium]